MEFVDSRSVGLQKLRKDAGFRRAADFAAAVGIPPTTYCRYEQKGESIPMSKALFLADWFDVPLDAVVGRELRGVSPKGPQQVVFDMLSPRGQAEVEKFMAYQMFLDGRDG